MPELGTMHVENFLSFGEVDFDFDDAGFVLVEGLNGSGKSGMVDALLWCLFGKTLRGYEHDEVIHRRKVDDGCVVKVRLTDGDELYTVTRSRRHSKLKTSLRLTHDNFGEDFSGPSEKETQAAIERTLRCSYKTFLQCVVFGQDRAYRFSSLTDAEQKKILDEVLGVERFADACAAARKQVSTTQGELASAERSLEKAETARAEAEAEAEGLQAKHVDFEASQRKRVEAEREKLRGAKEWLNKTRKIANVDALKAASEELIGHLAKLEAKVEKKVETSAAAQANRVGCKVRFNEAEADLLEHRKANGICPACGQKVTGKESAQAGAELHKKHEKLKEELAAAVRAEARAASVLSEDKLRLKELREEMAGAQRALNEGVGAEANAKAWRQRARDHEARIAEMEGETSPYAELADKARRRCEKHAAEADGLDSQITGLEGQLRLAEFWVKAFGASGLRSLLVDTSLPLLNEEAARVSRALTGGAIAVEFSATSEQKSGKSVDRFQVRVDNRHGAGDYVGNSSGERAKVDLCVGLALQRLVASRSSASFNLAIFDEVLDHVDSTAHEAVIEVLSELDKESVLVVSHDEDLKAWFPASWRFVKRDGFSSVET